MSFVRLGEAQFDPAVTLVDDAPATGDAFDAEGTPRRRTVLVDGGTTVSLTHDLRTAAVAGATSTGHGVGAPSFGALARHLCLVPAGRVGRRRDGRGRRARSSTPRRPSWSPASSGASS